MQRAGFVYAPPLYADLGTMLVEAKPEAVIISTPHRLHFEHVKQALTADCHAFVDKPLACEYPEAVDLVELADRRGRNLSVGNNRRFELAYTSIREILAGGALGRPLLVNYLFANSPWYDYSSSWRGSAYWNGGGAVMDIGHLAFDTLLFSLDLRPKWVQAVATGETHAGFERSAAVQVGFNGGMLASLNITYSGPRSSVQEDLSIYGTDGALFLRRFNTKRSPAPPQIIVQSNTGRVEEIKVSNLPDPSQPFQDFLKSIRTGMPGVSDGKSSLPTVQLIHATYESLRTGVKISFPD
jgi:predicted dehydrogenase